MSSRSNSDARRDPMVGVDLDDAEHLGVELALRYVAARGRYAVKAETLPADRDDRRRYIRLDLGEARMSAICSIATMSNPDVHDPTAIVGANIFGEELCHRVPVAGREVRPEAFVDSACRVFQLRRRTAQLVEAGERGVEVGLVEDVRSG